MLAMLLIPLLLKARHGLDIPDQIIQSTADEEAPLRKNRRKSHVGNKYDVSDLNCNASNENDDNRCIKISNEDCIAEKQNSEDSTTESFLSAIDFQDESTNTSMIPSEVPSNVSPLPAPLSTRSVRGVRFSSSVNHLSYPLNNGGQWNANTNSTSSVLRIQESTNQKNSLIEEDSFFEINSSLIPGSRSMRSSGNKSEVNTDTINDSGASSSDQWCDNALLKCNNPNGNNNSINKVSDEVANINHDDPSKRKYDQADFDERWPPENLISKVLHFLLKDVMGNAYASSSAQSPNFKSSLESEESAPSLRSAGTAEFEPPILTVELMKDILLFYGEREMALNDNLVREMIWAAAGSSGHIHDDNDDDILPLVRLDECAFARALTGDVQKHDIGSENKNSTNYFDVFKTLYSTKKSNDFVTRMTMEDTTRECANASDMIDDSSANVVTTTASVATELGELGLESSLHCRTKEDQLRCQNVKVDNEEAIRPVERIFTFPSIDYTVDSFRNKTFVVTLWVTYVVSYFAYLFGYSGAVDVDACGDTFGCIIGIGILKWIEVMVELRCAHQMRIFITFISTIVLPFFYYPHTKLLLSYRIQYSGDFVFVVI